jgi:hypothetical protein
MPSIPGGLTDILPKVGYLSSGSFYTSVAFCHTFPKVNPSNRSNAPLETNLRHRAKKANLKRRRVKGVVLLARQGWEVVETK